MSAILTFAVSLDIH